MVLSKLNRWWCAAMAAWASVVLGTTLALAQDQGGGGGGATGGGVTTTTSTEVWYGQWWVWAVGIAVFLIIVIALTNRGGRSNP